MSHSQTPSFFVFRANKQSAAIHHQRVQSSGGPGDIGQQQHLAPSSNTLAPLRQGQPLLQNIPASQPRAQAPPQQQTPPQQNNNQQILPPLPQSQQPSQKQHPQAPAPPSLHPEIFSVVQLTIAHAHKFYFSGPLVRRIERQPDGQKPLKDEGWTEVFARLSGTTLRVWDMKEFQEASKQGREVPPSYINVADAFIQALGSVTVPATPTVPSKRYTNIITLNTAGSNLLLFSCPSTAALFSWVAALRLAAWEKSRLEEIYTAHLIRITLSAPNVPTTLVQGKMEGWAKIRIAGQTDDKRVWLVVQGGSGIEGDGAGPAGAGVDATMKRKRMSNLFSRETNASNPLPAKSLISMFTSPKPKDRKKPLLTVHGVTQAFAVYPERPELINRSTVMKVEGTFGDDEMAATFRMREGWVFIMPELENNVRQSAKLLMWVVGLHDAFELYGRPKAWTWDPRDPVSLMFGYPFGSQRDNLFLERDIVEDMNLRDDRTSVIRSTMKNLLQTNLKLVQVVQPRSPLRATTESPPVLPPIAGTSQINSAPAQQDWSGPSLGPQLPPLRPLTPITDRSTRGRTVSTGGPSKLSPNHASHQSVTSPNDQQPGNSPSRQSSAGPAIPGPNASSFTSTSAADGPSTSTSNPILDRLISHNSLPTNPNTHPQNGLLMDASPTTINSVRLVTQSINSINQAISTTSLATSASPESPSSPAPRHLSASLSIAASVQAEPIPTSLRPGSDKPSGARVQSETTRRPYNGAESISSQILSETDGNMPSDHKRQTFDQAYDDPTEEVYAALTYLDLTEPRDLVMESSTTPLGPKIEPLRIRYAKNASSSSPQQPGPATADAVPYKSTFAPTNTAAERKLKAQVQQAAAHAADDMGSDGQKPMARGLQNASSSNNVVWPQIQTTQIGPNDYIQDVPPTPPHLQPPRNLPQVPRNGGQTGDFHQAQPMSRRQATEQYADPYRRSHSSDETPIQTQTKPGAARAVWSQVLDPDPTPGRVTQPDQPFNNGRDTFVQLEPSEAMTKDFTSQGLLSAGLQDEGHAARRQEELARANPASLINVPNKPPPQTGFPDAITTPELERKRGGDHQRQQLDQIQQRGSIYGSQFGFNPMMMGMNPMMAMNPMMTGNMAPFNPMMPGPMGYPGIMGGFNPQHMFAAQQAAQMYHQALMAFSTAGSQVGGEGGSGGAPSQVNAMTSGMGGMNTGVSNMNAGLGSGVTPGYNPRMSVMGMPMVGMGMGMGVGVGIAPPQMNNQMPPGIQITGIPTFDSKFPPGGANGSPAGELDPLPPNQNPRSSSRTSSPTSRGSPLVGSGSETADRDRPSRPMSPK